MKEENTLRSHFSYNFASISMLWPLFMRQLNFNHQVSRNFGAHFSDFEKIKN